MKMGKSHDMGEEEMEMGHKKCGKCETNVGKAYKGAKMPKVRGAMKAAMGKKIGKSR